MKKLLALFTAHPASVGESYFGHMAMAIGFGVRMLFCGIACLIHGLLPFLFVKTGSNTITHLHNTMVVNRNRAQHKAASNAAALDNVELTGSSQSSR